MPDAQTLDTPSPTGREKIEEKNSNTRQAGQRIVLSFSSFSSVRFLRQRTNRACTEIGSTRIASNQRQISFYFLSPLFFYSSSTTRPRHSFLHASFLFFSLSFVEDETDGRWMKSSRRRCGKSSKTLPTHVALRTRLCLYLIYLNACLCRSVAIEWKEK